MNFRKRNEYHGVSECGRYVICRARGAGYSAYTATRSKQGDNTILACERFTDDDDAGRTSAWQRAVGACERDAAVAA